MFVAATACVLVSVLQICKGVDLTYYVEEGKAPGTYLGDIVADTHLQDSIEFHDLSQLSFNQLSQGIAGSDQYFRVAKKTGKLYTTQTLDAEALCKHGADCYQIIKVAVRREENFMKIIKIKVTIQDVNDHQPLFPKQKVDIQFEEDDRKGARRSIPNAMDEDVSVINSQITYRLKKNMNEPFSLSELQSVDGTSDLRITLDDTLDRELKDSYIIQVIARDGGSPPKQSVLDVHISVTDVNDNSPVFSQKVYNVSIMYEHDRSTPVAILSARDTDSGKNSNVTYHFSSKTSDLARDHFRINQVTGEIFRQKSFKLGQILTYKLYVKATDEGNPPLSSVAIVLINMINQQNNVPQIHVNFFSASTDSSAVISEHVEVGSFIAYVMVTDPDFGQNGEVTCDLHHDKFQLQSLGPKEYKITVINPVDREASDRHEITISCQDRGSPPLRSEKKFSIKVMDVNDVRPQFSKDVFKFRIQENKNSQSPVGFINATDPDLGPGGQLTYSLLTNSKHFLPFQITNNGQISTVMSLDHEFKDVYTFQVFVKDNGSPSLNNTVNVTVYVKDENDNAPYFTYPSVNPFTLDFLYYPRHSKNITVLKASDIDSQENAFLRYEIIRGNEKQLFTVNHYSGMLSFTRELTHEDAGSYDLQFVVKDSGTPVLSTNVNMVLKLTVSNKTSEMLNSELTKSDDTIHLFLMIIIVVVAVSVSVSVTAGLSICIIRCKDRRNASNPDGGNPPCKCVTEHGHYMCSSQQPSYWPDDAVAQSTEPESSHSLTRRSRRGPHQGGELGNGQKTADSVYQEIGGRENVHKQFMTPDCHSEREDGWSIGDMEHGQEGQQDFNSSHHYKPLSSQTGQSSHKKPQQQSCFYPGDTNNISRPLHKPNIGHIPDCSQWIDLKPALVDNSVSIARPQFCQQPVSKGSAPGPKQALSVSQVQYLDYLG